MIVFLAGGFSSSSDTLKNRLEKNLKLKSFTFKSGRNWTLKYKY